MRFFFSSKKFKAPLNTAVFSTTYVIKEKSPILLVSHEADGDWQFMGGEPIEDYRKVVMVVSLESIIKKDKTVLQLADLPLGYQATRKTKKDKWEIVKIIYSPEELKEIGYYCSKCGVYHNEIPMAYGAAAPALFYLIAEDQREARCDLTDDQCIIDEEHFYIKGRIKLNVDGISEQFLWIVWVELNKKDFDRYIELWEDENRILEAPYPGELASQLELYPQTIGLHVNLIHQNVGIRPFVELQACNHPLFLEQESGIDINRVVEFASRLSVTH